MTAITYNSQPSILGLQNSRSSSAQSSSNNLTLTARKPHKFPKLVRALVRSYLVPLENVKNVEILVTDVIRLEDTGFDFPNLVQLELKFVCLSKQWDEVLDLLNHCPKLQHLVIGIYQVSLSNLFNHDLLRRRGTLEHLHLQMGLFAPVSSVVFTCKNLVVLKLVYIRVENTSFVDLPLLKILHLNFISVVDCPDLLQQFLSGCLNLEHLKVKIMDYRTLEEFQTLPKLVRAEIDTCVVPLEIVKNVQVLVTSRIYEQDLVFDLQNLVQLEFVTSESSEGWRDVLKVLRHCPKLQTLVISIEVDEEEAVLPYPHTVSTCISLHLKTCCVKDYKGCAFEFQFAEYIMLNANYLRTMKFLVSSYEYDDLLRRHDMIRDLSSCSKSSNTCTLSFEKSVNF
ncbi:F-box/FBD/LRR-repeat protein At5g56420-like [Phaseolus vulgaris]|uniref:F-box/FBD/LRR-repeat protein At5g56420-like n=1 Tax=Phaseolus vulgaris TaxID=3885 RepID=UPI0035CB3203